MQKIKFGSTEYMVDYEYCPPQEGDLETESLPGHFEVTEIKEMLSDDSLSENLIADFSFMDLMAVSNIIRNEVKHSY